MTLFLHKSLWFLSLFFRSKMAETVKGSSWEDLLDQENTAGFRRNPSYWPAGQEREPILGPGVKYANKSMFRPLYFAVLTLMVELNKTFAWLFNVLAHFYYSWHLSLCALTQHTTFSISCFGDIYFSGIDRCESYGDLNLIWHTTHGWTQPLRFILFQSTKLSLQFYLALFIAECRESTYIACEGKIDKKSINLFLTMQGGSFSLVEIIKG